MIQRQLALHLLLLLNLNFWTFASPPETSLTQDEQNRIERFINVIRTDPLNDSLYEFVTRIHQVGDRNEISPSVLSYVKTYLERAINETQDPAERFEWAVIKTYFLFRSHHTDLLRLPALQRQISDVEDDLRLHLAEDRLAAQAQLEQLRSELESLDNQKTRIQEAIQNVRQKMEGLGSGLNAPQLRGAKQLYFRMQAFFWEQDPDSEAELSDFYRREILSGRNWLTYFSNDSLDDSEILFKAIFRFYFKEEDPGYRARARSIFEETLQLLGDQNCLALHLMIIGSLPDSFAHKEVLLRQVEEGVQDSTHKIQMAWRRLKWASDALRREQLLMTQEEWGGHVTRGLTELLDILTRLQSSHWLRREMEGSILNYVAMQGDLLSEQQSLFDQIDWSGKEEDLQKLLHLMSLLEEEPRRQILTHEDVNGLQDMMSINTLPLSERTALFTRITEWNISTAVYQTWLTDEIPLILKLKLFNILHQRHVLSEAERSHFIDSFVTMLSSTTPLSLRELRILIPQSLYSQVLLHSLANKFVRDALETLNKGSLVNQEELFQTVRSFLEISRQYDPEITINIIGLLPHLKVPDTIPLLISLIMDVYEQRSIIPAAANALRQMGQPAADALFELISDESQSTRIKGAIVLGLMGDCRVLDILISMIRDEPHFLYYSPFGWPTESANAIATIGREAVEPLISLFLRLEKNVDLTDIDCWTLDIASVALGQIGAPAVAPLVALLRSKPRNQRLAGYTREALRQTSAAAVPTLVDLLRAEDVELRREAAWTLETMGPTANYAVPALRNALRDSDSDVRTAAVRALGNIGRDSAPAVPALVEALAREDSSVIEFVKYALVSIGQSNPFLVSNAVIQLLENPHRDIRMRPLNILFYLASFGFNEPIRALQRMLRHRDLQPRNAAVAILVVIGHTCDNARNSLVTAMIESLRSENTDVRMAACQVFEQLGTRGAPAVPALIEALSDTQTRVRQEAAEALGYMGHEADAAIPTLSQVAEHDNGPMARRRAQEAIRLIRGN